MILVGFIQAANCSNYPASWRHPATEPSFLTPGYYQDIARTLEEGKFHLAFIDDRLAMPSRYGDSFEESVQHGVRAGEEESLRLAGESLSLSFSLPLKDAGTSTKISRSRRPAGEEILKPSRLPQRCTWWPGRPRPSPRRRLP
jgi:hypothetical protein